MRLDLPLGVDVLVVGAIRYGPQSHVNTGFDTFAGMCSTRPESSYNQCLVGRPSWFLLSVSEACFKRTWANPIPLTFYPYIGIINTNLLADRLFTAIGLVLIITRTFAGLDATLAQHRRKPNRILHGFYYLCTICVLEDRSTLLGDEVIYPVADDQPRLTIISEGFDMRL